jgi:hypothetical protein
VGVSFGQSSLDASRCDCDHREFTPQSESVHANDKESTRWQITQLI